MAPKRQQSEKHKAAFKRRTPGGRSATSRYAIQRELYCRAIVAGKTTSEAAEIAGYSPGHAKRIRYQPEITSRIAEIIASTATAMEATAEAVIDRLRTIASADVRQLVQHRVAPCLHCWGAAHAFQWRTEREYQSAWLEWLEAYRQKQRAMARSDDDRADAENAVPSFAEIEADPRIPNTKGGFGYTRNAKPNPECPECDGLGLSFVAMADTAHVSSEAAAIFDGVKVTRDGIEMKVADRFGPLMALAKHHGIGDGKGGEGEEDKMTLALKAIQSRASSTFHPGQPRIVASKDDPPIEGSAA